MKLAAEIPLRAFRTNSRRHAQDLFDSNLQWAELVSLEAASAVENKTRRALKPAPGPLLDLQRIPWDCPTSVTLYSEKQFRLT